MNATLTPHRSAACDEMVVQEIAAAIDLTLADVQPVCHLRTDFGATDEDLHVLRVGLELTFSCFIPLPHVQQWKTVQDVQTYITGRLAAERITG